MKTPPGVVVPLLVTFLCGAAVLLFGLHHGHKQPAAQTVTSTPTSPTTSTTETSTTTQTSSGAAVTTSTTTTGAKHSGHPALSRLQAVQLLSETQAFMAAFYQVGPRDTDETHRAYLRQTAGPKTFLMTQKLARTIAFGLGQVAFTAQAQFNQIIWQKQLQLTGRMDMANGRTSLKRAGTSSASVEAYVLVRAYLGKLEEKSVRQYVLTNTTWQYRSGEWILQSFTPPVLKVPVS